MYHPNAIPRIGSTSRWNVKIRSRRQVRARVEPATPYFGVRTNSPLECLRHPDHIASSTALQLFTPIPTPSAIKNGMCNSVRHPASFPNSSLCPNTKNVLAEHVARMNKLKLNTYDPHV